MHNLDGAIAPSTQPLPPIRRSTRAKAGLDAPESSNNLGHFPAAAPETYPIPPLTVTAPPPDLRDNDEIFNLNDNTFPDPFSPPPLCSDFSSNKRPIEPAPALAPPPKRTRKNGNKSKPPVVPHQLQGIAPLPPQLNLAMEGLPVPSAPLANQPARQASSRYWQYVWHLGESRDQPDKYTIPDTQVTRSRSVNGFWGCRLCNKPGKDGAKSRLVYSCY